MSGTGCWRGFAPLLSAWPRQAQVPPLLRSTPILPMIPSILPSILLSLLGVGGGAGQGREGPGRRRKANCRLSRMKECSPGPTGERGTKRGLSHGTEYYSAIERNEALIHATAWVHLENIAPSERSQAQKATQGRIPLIGSAWNRQFHRESKSACSCQGLGESDGE